MIPELGRSPGEGKGYRLQYSSLENSMVSIVYGVAKSRTQLSDFHFHTFTTTFKFLIYLLLVPYLWIGCDILFKKVIKQHLYFNNLCLYSIHTHWERTNGRAGSSSSANDVNVTTETITLLTLIQMSNRRHGINDFSKISRLNNKKFTYLLKSEA